MGNARGCVSLNGWIRLNRRVIDKKTHPWKRKGGPFMRVIIIGAVAAGTSAATEIRRNHKDWEIIVYEKDTYISYVGCGMPFYISDEADSFVGLVPRGPEAFKEKDIDIFIQHEVLSIDPGTRTLTVQDLATDRRFEQSYDKLIIATGATARKPEIKGVDQSNVFILRNINHMIEIDAFIENQKPKKAAVIGGGFIGMEMVEAFRKLGMEVHLIARSSISKGIDKELTKVESSPYLCVKSTLVY